MNLAYINARPDRTQTLIDYFRGLPGEFFMLKGLLCAGHALDTTPARQQLDNVYDSILIAERMDQIRAEDAKREGLPELST